MANQGYRIRLTEDYRLPSRIVEAGEYAIDDPRLEGAGNWLVAVNAAELIQPEQENKPTKRGGKNA